MNNSLYKTIVWTLGALTLVSIIVAVYVGAQRMTWEGDYQQVSLALTGQSYLDLAASGDTTALDNVQAVVFDAATLEAFAPFYLTPLAAFESDGDAITNEQIDALNGQGLNVMIALPSLPVVDEARLVLLDQVIVQFDIAGVVLVETQTGWTQDNLRKILALLQTHGLWAATLEFYEPRGLLDLYREGHTNWVRAHIIPQRERVALSEADALDRYERAARERSLRLILLNQKSEAFPIGKTIDGLSKRLIQTGFQMGPVPSLPSWRLPSWTMWALSLALWTSTIWLFQRLWKRYPWVLTTIAVAVAGILFWQWTRGDDGLRFLSLSMAIIIPMCVYRGMMLLSPNQGLGYALRVFALGTTATVTGGLVQAALLSDPAYFLKLEQFDSVKLALFEPILVIAYWELKRRGRDVWQKLWLRPLTLGDALLGVAVAGGLAFVLLRSGNDSLLPVLPFEQELRGWLEQWLYARPRFKEFLLGHPLLIVWLAWGIWRWKEGGALIALIGFLGQTTILNSFAHLHTPLTLTLARTLNGAVLGMITGIVVWEIVRWLKTRQSRHTHTVSS